MYSENWSLLYFLELFVYELLIYITATIEKKRQGIVLNKAN